LEDCVDNRRLRRTVALVSEDADGRVTIRGGNDRLLPYRLFHTNQAQLVPGVVVEHKHLDAVFDWIAAQQRERDAARLANPKLTLRAAKRASGRPGSRRSSLGRRPSAAASPSGDGAGKARARRPTGRGSR